MERIKDMLEHIGAVYAAKNTKTAIDVDLMLDYTRELYADLLDLKKDISQASPQQQAGKASGTSATEPETALKERADTAEPTARPENGDQEVWEIQKEPQEPENAWEEKMEQEDAEKGAVVANEFPAYTTGKTDPARSGKPATDPKDEEVKILSADPSGISFEPPHPAEPEPESIKETLAEDAPERIAPVREIPLGEADKKLPDYAQIFKSARAVNNIKDIRKLIGINDKYLFLNELFNNNKTSYEEALDQINKMDHAGALKWTREALAVDNKWFEDDETVKSFYDILDKHFASR